MGKGRDDLELREKIKTFANKHRRYGIPRLCVLLKKGSFRDNHKRIERIYREEGLQVVRRKRKRTCRSKRVRTIEVPNCPNEKWSMDFIPDCMAGGRRFRCLTIVDDFTREAVHIEIGVSLSGQLVARVLDNGPEFASLVMDEWVHRNNESLDFIQPGKPTQNAIIESFNGKFRDECLNEH
jgi:putative transposase